ncbi:Glycosyltransferase involved in cell wall bisynthesis [Actinopolyspora alba]|uniref:Glycosyltransferase involved in cell wall bisynthesis n=1 Tax=Actinopolyspora alba TaxID=673379 RepID=A0A1I1Z3K5_9ACTN|nr:glycosyltransferase family 1 protein [Actinopolyspora alba]SFE26331.1 Glycosyltransferase involved in cell wall bisynthesis [Actinopolyspora alba]
MPGLVVVAEQLLAPVPGGTGRYTRELLRSLAATAPAGWEVSTVVSSDGDPARAEVDGVGGPEVLPLPRRALTLVWQYGRWPRVSADSVHAPTPLFPPVASGRGLVVTVHDTVPWTHPETLTARGAVWHRRAVSRAARKADSLVVPTEAVAVDLRRNVPSATRIEVIGEGVSTAVLSPGTAEAGESGEPAEETARRLRLPPRYLLAVGTIEPRKGYEWLIRALAAPEAPDVPLLVVGAPGWGDVSLSDLAARHGLPPGRLRYLGPVADSDLAVLLRRSAALVAPSMAEGFGLPVLEAMAAGTPVVHSDAPALVELADGAGVTVPRTDAAALALALREVLDDRRRSAGMIEAGRSRARRFDWHETARRVWRLHTGAADARQRHRHSGIR